jgi:hypothetical protein
LIRGISEKTVFELDLVIKKALQFIETEQLQNGGFSCLFGEVKSGICDDLGTRPESNKNMMLVEDEHTVFPATMIGHALLKTGESPQAQNILKGIVKFLKNNQKPFGLWCHYTKSHQLGHMIPSDLDNTAMASKLLKDLNVPFTDNKSLIQSNRNKKNQFFTWITMRFQLNWNWRYLIIMAKEIRHPIGHFYYWNYFPSNKYDIDVVVNSNVLYYLGLDAANEDVIDLIVSAIKNGNETTTDKWYPRPILIYYFISKNFKLNNKKLDALKPRIAEVIKKNTNANGQIFESVLDTALAVTTLNNMSLPVEIPEVSIQYLIDNQKENGGWDKWVLFYGNPNRTCGYGSETLTTAHVIEALCGYKQFLHTNDAKTC